MKCEIVWEVSHCCIGTRLCTSAQSSAAEVHGRHVPFLIVSCAAVSRGRCTTVLFTFRHLDPPTTPLPGPSDVGRSGNCTSEIHVSNKMDLCKSQHYLVAHQLRRWRYIVPAWRHYLSGFSRPFSLRVVLAVLSKHACYLSQRSAPSYTSRQT